MKQRTEAGLIKPHVFGRLFALGFLRRGHGQDVLGSLLEAETFYSQINGLAHDVLNVAELGGKSSGRCKVNNQCDPERTGHATQSHCGYAVASLAFEDQIQADEKADNWQ